MIKYIENIASWGLQIGDLKRVYEDKNITVKFTREFSTADALYKDGNSATSPLYYILQNGKVEKLERFLLQKYPDASTETALLMLQIREAQARPVLQPIDEETKPDVGVSEQETPSVTNVMRDETATTNLLQTLLQEMQQLKQPAAVVEPAETPPDVKRKREARLKKYNPHKTFEEEYEWLPALFNALYFLASPIVAGFGALFFYNQIRSPWLFAGVSVVFLLLELVFRRTIVRRCVAAFMRGKYIFGGITLLIALALSAWSIIALWNGTARIQTMQGVFQPSPATAQITALTDSLVTWRAAQKELEGKWGVSLHISKDLSKRIAEGEQQLTELRKHATGEHATGIAIWRYFFLLLEAIVLLALALPVWYEVRCVLIATQNET